MRYLPRLLPLFLLCYLPALQAGEWLVGVKGGAMLFDQSGVSSPTNVAVMAGYQVGVVLGDIGVEGELTTSVKPGGFQGEDVDLTGQGLFATFRSAGPLYLKAKGGVVSSEVSIGTVSERTTSEAYGLGVGLGLGITQLELEYTLVDSDNDIAFLSVGVQF